MTLLDMFNRKLFYSARDHASGRFYFLWVISIATRASLSPSFVYRRLVAAYMRACVCACVRVFVLCVCACACVRVRVPACDYTRVQSPKDFKSWKYIFPIEKNTHRHTDMHIVTQPTVIHEQMRAHISSRAHAYFESHKDMTQVLSSWHKFEPWQLRLLYVSPVHVALYKNEYLAIYFGIITFESPLQSWIIIHAKCMVTH